MFVLTIADSTPVLKIWIGKTVLKIEFWVTYGRFSLEYVSVAKEWVNALCVVCGTKFLPPILITSSYVERGVS